MTLISSPGPANGVDAPGAAHVPSASAAACSAAAEPRTVQMSPHALGTWALTSLTCIVLGGGFAKVSQFVGGRTWTVGTLFGVVIIVGGAILSMLAARAAWPPSRREVLLRRLVVLSTVLVLWCAWAALVLVVYLGTPNAGPAS